MSLAIELDRPDRSYCPGDMVRGVVAVNAGSSTMSHTGIQLHVEGIVKLQLSARSVGLFEAFYSSIRPEEVVSLDIDISEEGRLPEGVTHFPFEFPLEGHTFHETYHGVYVNTSYVIKAVCQRGAFSKNLGREIEFLVRAVPRRPVPAAEPVEFCITPEDLENVRKGSVMSVPSFKVSGRIDSAVCDITKPFTGHLTVEKSEAVIRSLELQLVRVESVIYAEGESREATEIQNIQLADGDVCCGLEIPIHMVFPRIFTCPSTLATSFKVEFEVNLVIIFEGGYLVTENTPLTLYR